MLVRQYAVADAVYVNGCFAVNVLSPQQRYLADRFAGRAPSSSRYVFDARWGALCTGSPVRPDAAAVFDCELRHRVVAGTHTVFLGQPRATRSNDVEGLTYRDRGYGTHRAQEV